MDQKSGADPVPYRVGIGTDVHRLVEGRRLVLGGIEIPHSHGLLGHSDADVVLHAVADALLGAAGLPDIGELFPDSDARYKNSDSRMLMGDVVQLVADAGYRVGNVDVCIHADAPKISTHKVRMKESIATLLGIGVDCVNIKGKTSEGVGPHDAIFCTAVVLLVRT
ncbi:MAG: 2-C-methyl-D-erythritol 2,4-cyclodiphosphate synthase [Planctomycetes bacterium]|nr:2-C-methyl-D-erythritol 2,4-cyclodiphosphate synthase [Planctomycetota bacterium]MBI3834175.1 2-C-methyl-D-erythritol 2,4-cyclodiphosphate synthase [Planctomycetota bacterium]